MSERELFEAWAYSNKWNIFRVRDMGMDHYVDEFVNAAWHGWQASANRQDYKLVPVEPTQEMLDKFPEVVYQDTYVGECYIWVDDETICNGYKAMIGAVE